MTVSHWAALGARQFAQGAMSRSVALLPLGAIEQHGPHLPVGTDSLIAQGMVEAVVERAPPTLDLLVLQLLEVTNSIEHSNRAGTLSLSREVTLRLVVEIARGVARVGVRKLVIINAHGGNVGIMVDASHAIRAELGMLCVATNWMRLGLPEGIISGEARALDIHGGQLETAIMRALQPDLVAMEEGDAFPSLQAALAERFSLLRAYGPVGFGWMGDDLNPSGVVGDARAARAEDGQAIIAHQCAMMVRLLEEVQAFTPAWFEEP